MAYDYDMVGSSIVSAIDAFSNNDMEAVKGFMYDIKSEMENAGEDELAGMADYMINVIMQGNMDEIEMELDRFSAIIENPEEYLVD